MQESVQSCSELSVHFPVFFSCELFLVAVYGWFAIQTNVWKCQNTTRSFLTQLHSSVIFCKILCIVPKVSIQEFSEAHETWHMRACLR